MKKTLPKGFEKLASSPTLDGIKASVTRYYAGEEKELRPDSEGFTVHSMTDGRKLSTAVVQTTRGFYFGYSA